MNKKDEPRPASFDEWVDIEVCSECRHRPLTQCNIHKKEVPDDYTCCRFGSSASV